MNNAKEKAQDRKEEIILNTLALKTMLEAAGCYDETLEAMETYARERAVEELEKIFMISNDWQTLDWVKARIAELKKPVEK